MIHYYRLRMGDIVTQKLDYANIYSHIYGQKIILKAKHVK